jgi:hypothetical protein
METKDIQIGKCYDIKVGKNTAAVRIMKAAPKGGWEAVNLATNNPVVIRTADRIVGPHNPKADKTPKASKEPKTGKPAKSEAKAAAPAPAKTDKPLSALDAALEVLAEAGAPMNCKQMIETMTEKGYWKPAQGKTPANTLHAAIGAEIKKKGSEARFEKVGRGQFAVRNTE